jgi:tetratricopeptide (TPR) repeat protein
MFHEFLQMIMGLVSPSSKVYDRAYRMYEMYVREIELDLLGPTPEQSRDARNVPELKEAKSLYSEALVICRQQGDGYNAAVVKYQIGLLYRLWGMPEEEIPCYEQALNQFEEQLSAHPNARLSISLSHFYLGQALIRTGREAKARSHLLMAEALDKSLEDDRRIPAIHVLLRTNPPKGN